MNAPVMDTLKQLEELALECGFTHTAKVDTGTIKVRSEIRDACAQDKCHSYGKNWACPPACGSLEECENRIRQYSAGLILQTTGKMEDSFDTEAISRISEEHDIHIKNFQEKLNNSVSLERQWKLLGTGPCKNCPECSYPQSPCRFPEKMIVSLEATGIFVTEFCKVNNIPYYYGPNTLTYVACVLT